MKKIDKSRILSTDYKAWEENLPENHPKYTSSKYYKRYYRDIVMNLFHCQDGLCAYTERRLCTKEYYEVAKWKDGKYLTPPIPQINGQLEHFDESLKSKKADKLGRQDWLWDNFFMIHSDTNTKKGAKNVDDILKPDSPNYDPFKLLVYSSETHLYFAHPDLEESIQERINNMILILGINFGAVQNHRQRVILKHQKMVQAELIEWNEDIDEFPTAFEMINPNV